MTTDQLKPPVGASASDPVRTPQASHAHGSGPASAARKSGEVRVTVVYACPDSVWQTTFAAAAGTDVATVLKQSGFAEACPDYPHDTPAVGIFGRRCQLDEIVSDADRIEIYRPLDFDPMESRRRRAAHRQAAAKKTVFRPRRKRNEAARDGNRNHQ